LQPINGAILLLAHACYRQEKLQSDALVATVIDFEAPLAVVNRT